MRNVRSQSKTRARRFAILLFGALALSLLGISSLAQTGSQQRTQEARPRRIQQQQQQQPSPSPTPQKQSGAPTLGEPPPPPPTWRQKPTPTPTPEGGEEVDPDARVTINTELVNLNVRVVDRYNRPINNVQQAEFQVFEDGVAQPVEFFTTEEVPVSYGLAIDTSGSLRSQIDKVIEAGKIIINSNKEGDETF